MDQCMNALFGSFSIAVLFLFSEVMPFIKRIDGNSITHAIIIQINKSRVSAFEAFEAFKAFKAFEAFDFMRRPIIVQVSSKSNDMDIFCSDPEMYMLD